MGQLRVTFKLGINHHLLVLVSGSRDATISISFPESANRVYVSLPAVLDLADSRGIYGYQNVIVERECSDEDGRNSTFNNCRRMNIPQDAAKALWWFYESIRYAEFHPAPSGRPPAFGHSTVAGYPVVPSEEIQYNPLVDTCDMEWAYESDEVQQSRLGGFPSIGIGDHSWGEAGRRFATKEQIPTYISFALDAIYFARNDPLRTIIMSCAAWEIALRTYLSTVASTLGPQLQPRTHDTIPKLMSKMRIAKGGPLFHDRSSLASEWFARQRRTLAHLADRRNKLLHRGEIALPEGAAIDSALAVLNAIEWLFE